MSDEELLLPEAGAGISEGMLPSGRVPDRIALCFSGGGLRATFFHLGVVRALRARGLLARVTQVYSVSGGSILGAHLVLNWEKYNGSDEDYARMEQELRAFGARDLRGRVVRRWLLGCTVPFLRIIGKFRRTELLEREYNRLYKRKSLSDLGRTTKPQQPEIHILATSFTTGNLCSFSRKGFSDGRWQAASTADFEHHHPGIACGGRLLGVSAAIPAGADHPKDTGRQRKRHAVGA